MHSKVENFKNGWVGIELGIRKNEIDKLIIALKELRNNDKHFHIRSDFQDLEGVSDIEIYIQDEKSKNNMELDSDSIIC